MPSIDSFQHDQQKYHWTWIQANTNSQTKIEREWITKKKKKAEDKRPWDNIKGCKVCIIGIPKDNKERMKKYLKK